MYAAHTALQMTALLQDLASAQGSTPLQSLQQGTEVIARHLGVALVRWVVQIDHKT